MSQINQVKIPMLEDPFLCLLASQKVNQVRGESQFELELGTTLTEADKLRSFILATGSLIELASKRLILLESDEVVNPTQSEPDRQTYRITVDFRITPTKESTL